MESQDKSDWVESPSRGKYRAPFSANSNRFILMHGSVVVVDFIMNEKQLVCKEYHLLYRLIP